MRAQNRLPSCILLLFVVGIVNASRTFARGKYPMPYTRTSILSGVRIPGAAQVVHRSPAGRITPMSQRGV